MNWKICLVLGALGLAACAPQTPAPPADAPAPQDPAPTYADVLFVRAVQQTDGTWTFSVTVQHPDTGWEHYADGWDVVLPDGTVLKPDPEAPFTRLLVHPHVDEQPFTRSQSGIRIPADVTRVTVRAHDLVHGYGGRELSIPLTASTGDEYEVQPNR